MKKNKTTEINILQILNNTVDAARAEEDFARGKQKMLADLIDFFSQPGVKVIREETVEEPEGELPTIKTETKEN